MVSLADTTRDHALVAQLLQWVIIMVLQLLYSNSSKYSLGGDGITSTNTIIHKLMRDAEGRKKEASKAIQTIEQHVHLSTRVNGNDTTSILWPQLTSLLVVRVR